MQKFIVWADGRKDEARVVEAVGTPEAIEMAEDLFNVEAGAVNVIDESRRGEAEYHGVAHAE